MTTLLISVTASKHSDNPNSREVLLRSLIPSDSAALSSLLQAASPAHIRYFHPFDFNEPAIRDILLRRRRDVFIGIEIDTAGKSELAGFYMLRGLDEGFDDPMFGIFC